MPLHRRVVAGVRILGIRIGGRNRYIACEQAGVEPSYETWNGSGSLTAFVLSLNLHRRQLTDSQRAMVGAKAKPMFEAEAAARKRATQNNDSARAEVANLPPLVEAGKARDKAAEVVNVSPRLVESASRVLREGAPELVKAVKSGQITMIFLRLQACDCMCAQLHAKTRRCSHVL